MQGELPVDQMRKMKSNFKTRISATICGKFKNTLIII